jgi:methyl-accepting chemotaxis protein
MKMNIGMKFTLAGGAILLVTIAAIGIAVSIRSEIGISGLIKEEISTITMSVADYAESKIESDIRTIVGIASSPDIAECLSTKNTGKKESSNLCTAVNSRLAVLGNDSGFSASYGGIIIMNPDGNVIAASKPSFLGINVRDREYFTSSMSGKTFVSKILLNKVSGDATVAISAPVKMSGSVIGVCAVFMNTAVITNEMAKFKLGRTGYVWVLDGDGLMVLHPNKDYQLKKNVKELAGMEKIASSALAGKTGIETYEIEKVLKIAGYQPVPIIGWNIVATMPVAEFQETSTAIKQLVVVVAIISLLIASLLMMLLARSIAIPIKLAADHAMTIAKGNLELQVPDVFLQRGDEVGFLAHAIKMQQDLLTDIVGKVTSSVANITTSGEEIAKGSQSMSQGASEQASSLEEISSSMEEMSANIKQNAENALATEKIARSSALSAEEGGKSVSETVKAMKAIASKTGIIEEIARSTNMLALNASIEAARAGEYGKGFAVVASEVGKLAERSQREAAEITALSAQSVKIAEAAGHTITDLIPEIRHTAELVQEISAASGEQNSGAQQINQAIIQLEKVVQQNASASEEYASLSEELSSQSEELQTTMRYFSLGNEQSIDTNGKLIEEA